MNNLSLTLSSFDPKAADKYSLSIRFVSDGFSFCVCDTERNRFVLLQHTSFPSEDANIKSLKSLLEAEPLFKLGYKEVRISIETRVHTQIPSFLFKEQEMKAFLKLAHTLKDEVILYNKFEQLELVTIYGVDKHLYNLLTNFFPKAKFFHQTTPLMATAEKSDSIIYLNVVNDFFDALFLKNGTLQLCTSFKYKTSEDFVFFVANIFEQLGLDRNTTIVSISGDITTKDIRIELLKNYVKQVQLTKVGAEQAELMRLFQFEEQKYATLLSLIVCE